MFHEHHKLLLQNATLPATRFCVHTLDLMHYHSSSIAVKSWRFCGRCWLLSDNYVHGWSGHVFAIIEDNIVVKNHVPIFIESLILKPNLNFRPDFSSENYYMNLFSNTSPNPSYFVKVWLTSDLRTLTNLGAVQVLNSFPFLQVSLQLNFYCWH